MKIEAQRNDGMTDLSTTIAPRSDQTNADDLIAGPITITITKVVLRAENKEQPIAISFEGDRSKPYLPGLSMRRVLVSVWGVTDYVGRSMTLYRDPSVRFGTDAVGGIRISHMSHIDAPVTLALTMSRASRKPYTVQPLVAKPKTPPKPVKPIGERVTTFLSTLKTQDTVAGVEDIWAKASKLREEVDPESLDRLTLAYEARLAEVEEMAKERKS